MDAWLRELAAALGAQAVAEDEIEELLGVARDVAHGIERKATPIATFLLGTAVARRVAGGEARHAALTAAAAELRDAIPGSPPA